MLYVLAKKDCEYLDTPVFSAGPDGGEDAVAVFTSRDLADQYIKAANWKNEYDCGSLELIQIARWIASAKEQGADMVVVDPNRAEHLDGQQQNVLFLDEMLETLGKSVLSKVNAFQTVNPK